ncbi:antirestriction protein ArdA [Sulfurimonas indica]|uniref:antirestriction protein ArdA n=1 Tax=Sulfurimonas indica TaxID=2508707 RepID=UPI0012653C56|nr:antirestriction protein ArdA [Sulfurimonas indica]
MRVYITDLQAYNEGHLVGRWLELPVSKFELTQALSEVLNEGEVVSGTDNHEELFITDYEADIAIDEYDDIYKLNELAEIIDTLREDELLKLKLLSHEGYNEREVLTQGIDNYDVDIYDYSNDTSFTDIYELLAYDMVQEGLFGDVPTYLENYIDYGAIGRDLSYDYVEFEHGVVGRVA